MSSIFILRHLKFIEISLKILEGFGLTSPTHCPLEVFLAIAAEEFEGPVGALKDLREEMERDGFLVGLQEYAAAKEVREWVRREMGEWKKERQDRLLREVCN